MPEFDAGYLLAPTAADANGRAMHISGWLHVFGVMLHSHDPEARMALMHSVWAAGVMVSTLPDLGSGSKFNRDMLEFIYTAPKPEDLMTKSDKKIIGLATKFSGWLLGFALRAAQHGRPDVASKSRILGAVSGQVSRSLATLENYWDEFRCVSHLWLMYDHFVGPCGIGGCVTLPEFLAGAEYLRQRGEDWKPLRARKPILDPLETWKVPPGIELPSICLLLPPPTPDEMRMFRD